VKAKFKTGDIISIPMYSPGLFIITNDNVTTVKGVRIVTSFEIRTFPDMNRDKFYRLPRHLYELNAKKVS